MMVYKNETVNGRETDKSTVNCKHGFKARLFWNEINESFS